MSLPDVEVPSPLVIAQGRAVVAKLLRSGDDGALTLGPEAAELVVHLAEQRLVAVEMTGTGFVLRLRRNDRVPAGASAG